MALIKCSECGKQMSDKASSCPHCGCPNNLIKNENIETEVKLKNVSRLKEKCSLITIGLSLILLIALIVAYVINVDDFVFAKTLKYSGNFYHGLYETSTYENIFFTFGVINYGLLVIAMFLKYKSLRFNKLSKIVTIADIIFLTIAAIVGYQDTIRFDLQFFTIFALTICNLLIPRIGKVKVEEEKADKNSIEVIEKRNKKLEQVYNNQNKSKDFKISIILLLISVISLAGCYMLHQTPLRDKIKQKTENLKVYIKTDFINIRKEPNTSSKIIGSVIEEEEYEVLDIVGGQNYIWYHIKYKNKEGYISNPRNGKKSLTEKWKDNDIIVVLTTNTCITCDSTIDKLKENQKENGYKLLILDYNDNFNASESINTLYPVIIIGEGYINRNDIEIEDIIDIYKENSDDNQLVLAKKSSSYTSIQNYKNLSPVPEDLDKKDKDKK